MDTPQENPQHETPQNNGSSAQKNSWFLRHPIITILIVLFLIGSVMKLCGNTDGSAIPVIASTNELGTMGTKAADQSVILVGIVDEIGDGRDFFKGVFVFHPHSSNLTKDSRIIACDSRSDVRTRNVKVGDIITISGFAKTKAKKKYIVISKCQFHGLGDRSKEVLANKEYL